jgi:hypothetical protein
MFWIKLVSDNVFWFFLLTICLIWAVERVMVAIINRTRPISPQCTCACCSDDEEEEQ